MRPLLLIGCMVSLLVLGACDATPGPEPLDRQPPEVSNLIFSPDTVDVDALPPDRVSDGQVTVFFALEVTAQDPDGSLDQVLFTIEPSSNPQGTVEGVLQPLDGNQYGAAGEVRVSASRDEVYTVRAFAIDDDEQVSNQVLTQFRLIAASEN